MLNSINVNIEEPYRLNRIVTSLSGEFEFSPPGTCHFEILLLRVGIMNWEISSCDGLPSGDGRRWLLWFCWSWSWPWHRDTPRLHVRHPASFCDVRLVGAWLQHTCHAFTLQLPTHVAVARWIVGHHSMVAPIFKKIEPLSPSPNVIRLKTLLPFQLLIWR